MFTCEDKECAYCNVMKHEDDEMTTRLSSTFSFMSVKHFSFYDFCQRTNDVRNAWILSFRSTVQTWTLVLIDSKEIHIPTLCIVRKNFFVHMISIFFNDLSSKKFVCVRRYAISQVCHSRQHAFQKEKQENTNKMLLF